MNCTSCGIKLDMRSKSDYVYASYKLQSAGFMKSVFGPKNYWVFCSNRCKRNADQDWISGYFERKHGHKRINFVP
jgi:hypothetical protein